MDNEILKQIGWIAIFSIIFPLIFILIFYVIRKNKGFIGFDIRLSFRGKQFEEVGDNGWKLQKKDVTFTNKPPFKFWFMPISVFLLATCLVLIKSDSFDRILTIWISIALGFLFGILFKLFFDDCNLWFNNINTILSFEVLYAFIIAIFAMITYESSCLLNDINMLPEKPQVIMLISFFTTFLFFSFIALTTLFFHTELFNLKDELFEKTDKYSINLITLDEDKVNEIIPNKGIETSDDEDASKVDEFYFKFSGNWFLDGVDQTYAKSFSSFTLLKAATEKPISDLISAIYQKRFIKDEENEKECQYIMPFRNHEKLKTYKISMKIYLGWFLIDLPIKSKATIQELTKTTLPLFEIIKTDD